MNKLEEVGRLLGLADYDLNAVGLFNKQVRMALLSPKKVNWVISKAVLGATLKVLHQAFEALLLVGGTIQSGEATTEQTEKDAVIALRYWKNGGTSFSCQLFSLLQKSDSSNFNKLQRAFPVETAVFLEWMRAPDVGAFWLSKGFAPLVNVTEEDRLEVVTTGETTKLIAPELSEDEVNRELAEMLND